MRPNEMVLQSIVRKALPFAILLLALLPFLPNLTGYFLADDFVLLKWTQIHSLRGVLDFFDPNTFWFYRPLVKVYYWAGQSLFGLHPFPFHLFSVLLHLANGFLIYHLVARQPKIGRVAGLIAALIFMLTPYNTETVSWIAAIGDLVAVFCILSALILFQFYREQSKPAHLILPIMLFAVGLFTREITIILPVLLILDVLLLDQSRLDIRVAWQRQLARVIYQLAGYLVVVLLYLGIQFAGRSGATLERGGLGFHALSIASILLGIMDYVHGLLPGGGLLAALPLEYLRVIIWVEAAILLVGAALLWRGKQYLALFGLTWMLVTPLLFIFFSAPTDRYFYLPAVGYAILVSSLMVGLERLVAVGRPPLLINVAGVVAIFLIGSLLFSQTLSLLAKQNRWRTAGHVSGSVVHDLQQAVPDPHDYGAFYLVDMPATLDGVPFLGNDLQQAIQLIYNNQTLTASSVSCDYLAAQAEPPKYGYLFRFKDNRVEQLATKEGCR